MLSYLCLFCLVNVKKYHDFIKLEVLKMRNYSKEVYILQN